MDEGALDDLSYLTRAEVRVRLLDRLVEEGPLTREQLRETGVARETLRRTLAAFETRGWAAGTGNTWRATPLGAHLARVVATCLDEVAAANEVADAVALLPAGARSLGMEPYLDAEVVAASRGDPTRPVRRALEPLRRSTDVDLLAGAVTVEALAASAEGVENGQRFRAVFDAPTAAAIRENEDLAAAAEGLLAAEHARLWTVDAEFGYSAGLADGTVAFGLSDDRGAPAAYLETDDERVGEWFAGRFEELVAAADPLALDEE
jgi:predicted transcriptional regulator